MCSFPIVFMRYLLKWLLRHRRWRRTNKKKKKEEKKLFLPFSWTTHMQARTEWCVASATIWKQQQNDKKKWSMHAQQNCVVNKISDILQQLTTQSERGKFDEGEFLSLSHLHTELSTTFLCSEWKFRQCSSFWHHEIRFTPKRLNTTEQTSPNFCREHFCVSLSLCLSPSSFQHFAMLLIHSGNNFFWLFCYCLCIKQFFSSFLLRRCYSEGCLRRE